MFRMQGNLCTVNSEGLMNSSEPMLSISFVFSICLCTSRHWRWSPQIDACTCWGQCGGLLDYLQLGISWTQRCSCWHWTCECCKLAGPFWRILYTCLLLSTPIFHLLVSFNYTMSASWPYGVTTIIQLNFVHKCKMHAYLSMSSSNLVQRSGM